MDRRLVTSYVLLVTLALALFTVPVAASSQALLKRTLVETSTREAELFVPLVVRDDEAAAQSILDRTRDFERATGARVEIVRAGPAGAATDAQVEDVLAGRSAPARWGYDAELGLDAVSVAVPVEQDGTVVAAVQVVAPAEDVQDEIRGIWVFRLGVGAGVLLLTSIVAFALARTISRPLRRLDAVARRLGQGDFTAVADESGVPEIASLGATLNRTSRQTEVLLASQRAFVADASHQLRTPLTALRLSVDNLRETSDDPATVERLDSVDGEIRRMGRLVEDLLALARAEGTPVARREVDVADLVADRLDTWGSALEDADLGVDVRVAPGCRALATSGALEQVLDNLLDNAITAAPPGSTLHVGAERLEHRGAPARVLLTLADEGAGLTAAERERAFDRFWTSRPGGSGLGLTVVRQLVERDGGEVRLDEAPGGGVAVRVSLPAAG